MTTNPTDRPEPDPEQTAKRIRMAVIGGGVLFVAALVFFIWRALEEESTLERWDVFEEIRVEYEPNTDPLWRNPFGVYNPERKKFIGALEKFLEAKAEEDGDALAPHTRYVLAKTIADHILSNPGILDQAERGKFYDQATKHLEAIRDNYPDFPLNWSSLSDGGFPTLTRQFLSWLKTNKEWEQENMMRAVAPTAGLRVLVRTERGDILMGLYREQAPNWTAAFIERAINGFYDGTFFSMKTEIGDVAEPEVHSVLAGGAATRELLPWDTETAVATAEVEVRSGLMPEESRNLIPQERGIVSAWHSEEDTYDSEARFLVLTQRSPRMDYDYTPIGKVLDEDGFESLLALDRIFAGEVWQADATVREDEDMRPILDYLQVPVRIVKVLVYENGSLKQPGEGALKTKAALEPGEEKLSSVQKDRYKQEAPARPGEAPDGDAPEKDEPEDGSGDDDK